MTRRVLNPLLHESSTRLVGRTAESCLQCRRLEGAPDRLAESHEVAHWVTSYGIGGGRRG